MDLELKRGVIAMAGPHTRWNTEAILANARTLQHLGNGGTTQTLLKGKHVALLSEAGSSGDAQLFTTAAKGLGARVAAMRAELWTTLPRQEIHRMAALLGRLYSAVECQAPFHCIAPMIAAGASIAVYDYVASPEHPTARITDLLEGDASADDKRRLVLQAVLLATIA